MDRLKLEILGLSSSQSQSGSFALVLGESKGNRRLPIIIGMYEAQAIAIEIEKISPNRPLTHDLFKSFAYSFDYQVEEVIISDLKEGVFFAKIICRGTQGIVEIDSRPSDAIAIALRFEADIYSTEKIMSEAGIVLSDEVEEEITELKSEPSKETAEKKPEQDQFKNNSVQELNDLLEKAIKSEDYERAAKIRDELSKRN